MFLFLHRARHQAASWAERYAFVCFTLAFALLVAMSCVLVLPLDAALERYFDLNGRAADLRTLLQTLGGALLGAAAIVSSLVLFAMQVNIERMPHGLFRRLSGDVRLLTAFAASFLLAIGVAVLPMMAFRISLMLLLAGWSVLLVLALFFYAYRRALVLVNPLQQIDLLVQDTARELRAWGRRADRIRPLLEKPLAEGEVRPAHDVSRMVFFRSNSHWTAGALAGLRHATSFARRYAGQGDHEVSGYALEAVRVINEAYVAAKGKTFIANVALLDDAVATDGFINETLEELRQLLRAAVTAGDEELIEQTLGELAALARLYLGIDYSNEYASKSHAHLAAGYLATGVQSVLPHNMPDVLMQGARLMGSTAEHLLAHGRPDDVGTLVGRIGALACVGAVKDDYRPVTSTCMEQLASLTFGLFHVEQRDIHFAAKEIREWVGIVASTFLKVPDTPLNRIHSTYLGPYYSGTSGSALLARLRDLANAISQMPADNEVARGVVGNVEQWAEDLYQSEKPLLLAAVKAKSGFAFDMVHWITEVTKILLALANAPACDEHTRGELREHARELIFVLSAIPRHDKDIVAFVENYRLTERLFEAAVDARTREAPDIADEMAELLLSWGFDAGTHQTGWGIFERALAGSAVLALRSGETAVDALKADILRRLAKSDSPDAGTRSRVAAAVRRQADELHRGERSFSAIEHSMARSDHRNLRPLLLDIAQLFERDEMPRTL